MCNILLLVLLERFANPALQYVSHMYSFFIYIFYLHMYNTHIKNEHSVL
jgi:hypothetical protein